MTTDEPITQWVHRVDALLDDRFRLASRSGLTRRHWQVLTVLVDGVSEAETSTGVLRGYEPELADLSRRGWIGQGLDGYRVTLEGTARYQEALEEVVAQRAAVLDGIDPGDLATAVDVLRRMAGNLGD